MKVNLWKNSGLIHPAATLDKRSEKGKSLKMHDVAF